MKTFSYAVSAVISSLVLASCGGDSSSSSSASTFSLGISDAPVDDAKKVVIAFEDIVLVPVADDSDDDDSDENSIGDPVILNVSENGALRRVDLLQYQGSSYDTIINGETLSPGKYAMCVYVKDGTELNDDSLSYVEKTDGSLKGLVVPSKGSCFGYKPQTEDQGRLKFSGKGKTIEISAGANQFVLEFDLRKGLTDPSGQDYMIMNSNAVTLVSLSESGEIEGDVATAFYQACEADQTGLNAINDAPATHAVYLYSSDIDIAQMGDLGATDSSLVQPVAVANVTSSIDDGVVEYEYEFGFVGPGTYTLGYTCSAYSDNSESAEGAAEGFAIYKTFGPAVVTAGNDTDINMSL